MFLYYISEWPFIFIYVYRLWVSCILEPFAIWHYMSCMPYRIAFCWFRIGGLYRVVEVNWMSFMSPLFFISEVVQFWQEKLYLAQVVICIYCLRRLHVLKIYLWIFWCLEAFTLIFLKVKKDNTDWIKKKMKEHKKGMQG